MVTPVFVDDARPLGGRHFVGWSVFEVRGSKFMLTVAGWLRQVGVMEVLEAGRRGKIEIIHFCARHDASLKTTLGNLSLRGVLAL
jgi:hypothetical protein